MEWTTLLRYLQALKDRRPSVLEAKKPLPRVWSWMVRNLCSAVIIAIGVTLCIGVTNYLPRGPKSGGQEILLLSRTKHSTKKNQPTIMEFLSPFSGFGCRGLVFLLPSFVVSGISERRFSARPRSWNFLMLAIPGAERWCVFMKFPGKR